jgi:uncharacterized membrane protein (UPF0127 family)
VGGFRRWAPAIAITLGILTFVFVGVLLAEPDPATTTTSGPPGVGPSTTFPPDPLAAFDATTVKVSGESWDVAVAAEPHERVQGLMLVTDLGELEGMLFVWEEDTTTPFWMKNTPLPLDIAFFAADGTLVDLLSMEPCQAEPCPYYYPAGPYRYALEAPTGAFDGMDRPFLALES